MRITIVINSLSGGGAERTALNLAGVLAERGHAVSLLYKRSAELEYAVPAGVRAVAFHGEAVANGLCARVREALKRARNLRAAILSQTPEVVLVFTSKLNVRVLLALSGSGVPVVVSERNNPREKPLSGAWRVLQRMTYRRAATVVSLSRGIDRLFGWLPQKRRAVIYNPAPSFELEAQEPDPVPRRSPYRVAAMGRLVPQKGFDLLLTSFAEAAEGLPDWELVILGDGPELKSLRAQLHELGLDRPVQLPGRVSNPYAVLARSELFVFSSRYEGLGNSLLEAMACNTPVVSFDCPSGPGELIEHEVSGLLVPPEDTGALASAMRRLMQSAELRATLAEGARQGLRRFEPHRIAAEWEALFRSVQRR